ncbi:hypothetical protein NL676_028210 [Syzygium grande]|nr:hypothetical protein NL676_028210 [Syzygium grande]
MERLGPEHPPLSPPTRGSSPPPPPPPHGRGLCSSPWPPPRGRGLRSSSSALPRDLCLVAEGDEDRSAANERGLFDEAETDAAATDLREPPPTGTLWRVPPGSSSGGGTCKSGGAGRGVGRVAVRAGQRLRLMVQAGSSPLRRQQRLEVGPAYARACQKACLLQLSFACIEKRADKSVKSKGFGGGREREWRVWRREGEV